jgi:hypothetical protein
VASTTTQKSVDYIINSKKPYPDWLKGHAVFKNMGKIDKIFPRIGLPNFRETADIMNTAEAKNDAINLVSNLNQHMLTARNAAYTKLNEALLSKDATRAELCNKLQSIINIVGSLTWAISFQDYITFDGGKINLKLRCDVFNGDKNPVLRKDESILRAVGKVREMCITANIPFVEIDKIQEFKNFSRTNIPNKKYMVVFSSTGEDGAWDMATMSMRGIQSCQAWTSPQSRGLIGSLSSKFVGVMYIASDQDIPGYGSKMMNRSVVRFAIHTKTKRPALLIDRMYPAENKDTVECFKKILHEKTGLDVVYAASNTNDYYNYYIPDEPSNKLLAPGETSYMDTKIAVVAHTPSIKAAKTNLDSLTIEFKSKVCAELNNMVRMRREMYEAARAKHVAIRAEYDAAKAAHLEKHGSKPASDRPKFELHAPKMENELTAFGGGGVINLFEHCDKRYGANSAAGQFATIIFNNIEVPHPEDCETPQEYHRRYMMSFLRNPSVVKAAAWRAASQGTWMKSFPKSADKFFMFVFGQMRGFMMNEVRAMIKKQN